MSALRELNQRYRGLFHSAVTEGDAESEDDTVEGVEKTEEEDYFSKWGWVITLDALSQGDHSKWEYYTNMNVIEFLNIVSFQKDKNAWQKSLG